MMAELFGRATGVCKGKGGSMHIADLDRGMLGANGIVGAGIPLAVGAGLTCSVKGTGGVSVAFFGDGATNQGQFHEALNLAAIWKLPVVFVAENNLYGEATPYEFVTPVRDLAERARSYAMRAEIADGMDFFDVHEKANPPSSEELAKLWGPIIETCIENFGVKRTMLESNFPVDKGSCSYGMLWNTFKRITAKYSAAEKDQLYRRTAAEAYRLSLD